MSAGAPPLRPVTLRELRSLAEGGLWPVDQTVAGIGSLTPVRGWVRALHHGRVLEVEGEADTIVTLRCDRCLQHFNHPLHVEVRELLEIAGEQEGGDALEPGDLLPCEERLDPRGGFDPEGWLFEQLSLLLPPVNRCGPDCPGPDRWSSDGDGGDPRWAALRSLRART